MTEYKYDELNRLISVGGITYKYDGEGIRLSQTYKTGSITYVTDPNTGLSRVLQTTAQDGRGKIYVYGLGLISEEVTTNGAKSNFRVYHYDHRGSTIALTSQTGAITDYYVYDAYGALLTSAGSTKTMFLYAGRFGIETDQNGLVYMRARYYNTDIQRFVNVDPIKDGQNWYAYVNGNPIGLVDPNGEFAILPFVAIGAGLGAIIGAGASIYKDMKNGDDFWSAAKKSGGSALKGAVIGAVGFTAAAFTWTAAPAFIAETAIVTSNMAPIVNTLAVGGANVLSLGVSIYQGLNGLNRAFEAGSGYNPIRDGLLGGDSEAYLGLDYMSGTVAEGIMTVSAASINSPKSNSDIEDDINIEITSDSKGSITARVPNDPKGFVTLTRGSDGSININGILSGDSTSGSKILTDTLRKLGLDSNKLIIKDITNTTTLDQFSSGHLAKDTLLGRTGIRALKNMGYNITSAEYEIIGSNKNIIITYN